MKVYRVHYFDNVAWKDKSVNVIAENEEEINNALSAGFYTNIIINEESIISTPYVLDTWDNDF